MAINTDPRRDPRSYQRTEDRSRQTAIWILLALMVLGLVIWFSYEASNHVPETVGPAGVIEPEAPQTTAP